MIEGIASLQGVLDRYPLPLRNTDYSQMFSELFRVFDGLVTDESYYSAVMRRFSSYLKTGIFFDSVGQQSLFELITLTNNPDFKTIVYGNFGKKEKPSYLDTILSILQVYRADIKKFEQQVFYLKNEIQSSPMSSREG
jgi:hypothetical protein